MTVIVKHVRPVVPFECFGDPSLPCIIVCPGGAYATLSGFEGMPVAQRFVELGFRSIVVSYGVQNEARMPGPLLQLGSVVAWAKERSPFVAVCGFSAGGHLCALLSNRWGETAQMLGLPEERVRPDAALLCYALTQLPCKSELQPIEKFGQVSGETDVVEVPDYFKPALVDTPQGQMLDFGNLSIRYLTGSIDPDAEILTSISPVDLVSERTTPAFLWANATDEMLPCQHSIQYFQALRSHNVQAALHLFSVGLHGEGLAQDNPQSHVWTELAASWLRGLLLEGSKA